MKAEAKRRSEEKEAHLKQIIGPLNIEGLNEKQLHDKVNELHKRIYAIEEEKYDLNLKIIKQDHEINKLNMNMNDVKGKFIKPVLKKVSKTEQKFKKLAIKDKGDSAITDTRQHLKSSGHSKFALDEKDETAAKPDWLDHLKEGKDDHAGHAPEVST